MSRGLVYLTEGVRGH